MSGFFYAFFLSLSLFMGIGIQSAFLIKEGLKDENLFIACLTCFCADTLLSISSVAGIYALTVQFSWIGSLIKWTGIIFLAIYGTLSFYSAFKSTKVLKLQDIKSSSVKKTIAIALAVTLLNPHVYLDMLLVGSVANQFQQDIIYFTSGIVLAAFVFLFSLGYSARLLKPLFKKSVAWRLLDGITGLVMVAVLVSLLLK